MSNPDPNPPPSSPPLRLSNPYKHPSSSPLRDPKVVGRVSQSDHDYIFRHLLTGEHGAADALVGIFFEKFCSHLRSLNIPAVWDEKNPALLASIISNLNFNARTPEPVPPNPSLDRGAPPRRRAAGSPTEPSRKPAARNGQ